MNTDILRKAVVPATVGAVGLSVGGVLGYIVGLRKGERRATRRQLQLVERREKLTDEAVATMEAYNRHDFPVDNRPPVEKLFDIRKDGKIPYYTPPATVKEVEATNGSLTVDGVTIPIKNIQLDSLTLTADEDAPGHVELVKEQNAFNHPYDVNDDKWDWERELNERSNKPIYVITTEEFRQGEMGFRQSTLIFYEGDRMVTDELGEPIYNWTSHVGTELPFGHGTGDENVLFVRNESLKWEYEIQRDPGRFDVEVQAHDIQVAYDEDDLKHMHRPLKMRRE